MSWKMQMSQNEKAVEKKALSSMDDGNSNNDNDIIIIGFMPTFI